MIIFYILIGLVVAGLIWRYLSHRYELPCPWWLGWMIECDNPFAKQHHADVIISHLKVDQGMTILDAGCGPGRLTIPMARKVGAEGRVVALDLQQRMLDQVGQKADKEGLTNIDYLCAGLGKGALTEATFDRAVLVTVLGEVLTQLEALQELFTTLKRGGILSVTEIIFDPHYESRKKVVALGQQVGFKEVAFFGNRWGYTVHLLKPKIGLA